MAEPSADAHRSDKTNISPRPSEAEQQDMELRIGLQQRRKLKAQSAKNHTIWFGLGMMGLIGWSVAVPALAGIAIGLWIDHEWPGRHSWTLMLMIIGLGIGCLNAWNWLQKEGRIEIDHSDQHNDTTPSSIHKDDTDVG